MKILVHWIVSAIAILIAAYILPGVHVTGFVAALILAVVLGVINAFIRPLIIMLTLPITIITFGLFVLVINAVMVMIAAAIVPGFSVDSFAYGFLFAIVLAIVMAILHSLEPKSVR